MRAVPTDAEGRPREERLAGAAATHRFGDHTGEVRLHVEAPTLAELFEEAGKALGELMLGESSGPEEGPTEPVHVRAADRAGLLAEWLNELIYLSETRGEVYTEIQVDRASDAEISARVRGVVPAVLRTAVKAATLHDLEVSHGPEGYRARVVLDV